MVQNDRGAARRHGRCAAVGACWELERQKPPHCMRPVRAWIAGSCTQARAGGGAVAAGRGARPGRSRTIASCCGLAAVNCDCSWRPVAGRRRRGFGTPGRTWRAVRARPRHRARMYATPSDRAKSGSHPPAADSNPGFAPRVSGQRGRDRTRHRPLGATGLERAQRGRGYRTPGRTGAHRRRRDPGTAGDSARPR
jgi:hypothetical protein